MTTVKRIPNNFYDTLLLNREVYKGRGRPRNSDYFTLVEAQRRLNELYNGYLDYQKSKW